MKYKKIFQIIFVVAFSFIILFFSCSNIKIVSNLLKDYTLNMDNLQEKLQEFEVEVKSKFKYRNELIDLYGVSLLAFQKNMVGNFEFVKDNQGIMQRFEGTANTDKFQKSLLELKRRAGQLDTPFVYINLPNKADGFKLSEEENFSGQTNEELLRFLYENNFDILDVQKIMEESPDALSREEVFFKTDVHLSTQAEFWMSNLLVEHLQQAYDISFQKADMVFDESQYDITLYDFIGNTARSSGRYFSGIDKFGLYIPKFETDLDLIDKNHEVTRSGAFDQVVMNGYEKKNHTEYTYWITNYGHYPEPYYQYKNNLNEGGPKLLIIADSLYMRATSFLSLACSNVTVVDIRYMGDINYVEQALNESDYDAIIMCASSKAFLQQEFVVETQLPDLPEHSSQTSDEWIGSFGNCIEKLNDNTVKNTSVLTADSDVEQITLQGWSIDFQNEQPLSGLYLKVGNYVLECSYGIKRPSIAEYFKNQNYENVGFQVSFPSGYLAENGSTTLQFIQISADGTYRYQPISYEIVWS